MSYTIKHYAIEARKVMLNEVVDWVPRGYAEGKKGQEGFKFILECLDSIIERS